MKEKKKYKIKNWPAYNQALVQRGSLTIWFDESQIDAWYAERDIRKQGVPFTYSDISIQCGLVIREVFSLSLRATEGFVRSITQLMGLSLDVPNYTTLSRRQSSLDVEIPRRQSQQSIHIAIDSTGLKVYGDGEWKVRQHGISKRRIGRKLHLGVDIKTQDIIAAELTTNEVGDSEVLPDLLNQLSNDMDIGIVSADGAYDTAECHEAIMEKGALALIPPREGAVEWDDDHPRTQLVRLCYELGKREWKKSSGYHRRSLSETTMFRLKYIFGSGLKNRLFRHQMTESYCRIAALNKMTFLGLPDSILVDTCA